jgi:hypothetical protein
LKYRMFSLDALEFLNIWFHDFFETEHVFSAWSVFFFGMRMFRVHKRNSTKSTFNKIECFLFQNVTYPDFCFGICFLDQFPSVISDIFPMVFGVTKLLRPLSLSIITTTPQQSRRLIQCEKTLRPDCLDATMSSLDRTSLRTQRLF